MAGTRQSLRYAVALRRDCMLCVITFKDLAWKEIKATVVDISRQGVGMESDTRTAPGFVWFRDRLGGFKGGILMWSRQSGNKHRAGIRFVPLTYSEEQFIQEQVALLRSRERMENPEAVIATIMGSFSRTSGNPKEPDPVTSPDRAADSGEAFEDDVIAQLRTMLSKL